MWRGRRRQGCSRMRQDLITPYNVLFCECLAYTPVPVHRFRNTVNTPLTLFFFSVLSVLPFPLLPFLRRRCRPPRPSSFSYSAWKCGWLVCTRHKACLQPPFPNPPPNPPSPPSPPSCPPPLPSGVCVLLYALPYLLQGNKRVNLDIMDATVAAHKTIVQDISLASPFRISAPLYWHARFSFFFVFFHFLFRLHGVLRRTLAFEAMIMRPAVDGPPMLSIIRRPECISGYLSACPRRSLRFRR